LDEPNKSVVEYLSSLEKMSQALDSIPDTSLAQGLKIFLATSADMTIRLEVHRLQMKQVVRKIEQFENKTVEFLLAAEKALPKKIVGDLSFDELSNLAEEFGMELVPINDNVEETRLPKIAQPSELMTTLGDPEPPVNVNMSVNMDTIAFDVASALSKANAAAFLNPLPTSPPTFDEFLTEIFPQIKEIPGKDNQRYKDMIAVDLYQIQDSMKRKVKPSKMRDLISDLSKHMAAAGAPKKLTEDLVNRITSLYPSE